MKTCENCGIKHTGKYGSGRFCSTKCSRGFSTKAKRKEINEKVSLKLKREAILHEATCTVCNNSFASNKPSRKCCSAKCSAKLGGSAIKRDTSKMGGLRDGGGRSKVYSYTNRLGEIMKLNIEEIEVAKILDELELNWLRNFNGFLYSSLDGKNRKFYPDFYVKDFDYYIEYKGWVTSDMEHKMVEATKQNDFKLLIVYGNDKRYKNLGLNIQEILNDPLILMNEIMAS